MAAATCRLLDDVADSERITGQTYVRLVRAETESGMGPLKLFVAIEKKLRKRVTVNSLSRLDIARHDLMNVAT